ncbi:hypothetical protein J14TS5_07040 [Paenibacillus lautus]|uniref:dockerin type I domain-containing protein n=1 Tax=Paenibacillus lautus TaxID=1401 RepID=UPI001B212F81|nr:dockerin type I domain-containing protein [Paenibacillus lautus]GIO95618.1 hypothetical protein J14TS5_07040 [Paenibacillus lautus]
MTATPPVVEGTPLHIHVIEKGSNNQLFMSTLGAGTGAVYDPNQNNVVSISLGQADSMVYHDNAMYMGVYPKAYVHKYDQNREPGKGNPSQFLQVDPETHQDRLIEATSGGGCIYFGSVSAYGVNGGAVTIIDPSAYAENQTGVKVNVVQDQSVVGLAYKDGIIFGSTNINNGLGSNPTAAALFGSKLIAIDPVTLEYRDVTSAYSFTIGDDGYLYFSDGSDRTFLSRIHIGTKVTIPEDVDGNVTVDHHDIRLVARHIGKEPVGELRKLDVNQEGKINAEDVRRVTAKMNKDRKQK